MSPSSDSVSQTTVEEYCVAAVKLIDIVFVLLDEAEAAEVSVSQSVLPLQVAV